MTDFITKIVVKNVENVQTGRLVTKLTERVVKMVVVLSFYLLFAKNASVVIMGKTVT